MVVSPERERRGIFYDGEEDAVCAEPAGDARRVLPDSVDGVGEARKPLMKWTAEPPAKPHENKSPTKPM